MRTLDLEFFICFGQYSLFAYLDSLGISPKGSNYAACHAYDQGPTLGPEADGILIVRKLENCKIPAVRDALYYRYLESKWLIILGYFKPILVNFGVWRPIISSYLAVQVFALDPNMYTHIYIYIYIFFFSIFFGGAVILATSPVLELAKGSETLAVAELGCNRSSSQNCPTSQDEDLLWGPKHINRTEFGLFRARGKNLETRDRLPFWMKVQVPNTRYLPKAIMTVSYIQTLQPPDCGFFA